MNEWKYFSLSYWISSWSCDLSSTKRVKAWNQILNSYGEKKKIAVLIIFENFSSQKSAGRDHGQTQGIKKKPNKTKPPSFCSGIYATKGAVKAWWSLHWWMGCFWTKTSVSSRESQPLRHGPWHLLLLLPFLVILQHSNTWVLCSRSYPWCLSLCKWISPSPSCLLDLIVLVLMRTVFVFSKKYWLYNWFLFLSPASAFHLTFRGIMPSGFFFPFTL